MVLENFIKLLLPDSVGKLFLPLNNGEVGQKEAKYGVFLNLKKNLVINFPRICSIMKIYIICCVPIQILYLGKMLFLRDRPKCSQPFKLRDF